MRKIKAIQKADLFQGIHASELDSVLEDLDSQLKYYRGRQTIIKDGSMIHRAGLLLEGSVIAYKEDYWNNKSILRRIHAGEIFAENNACIRGSYATYSVEAETAAVVLWFNMHDIMSMDGTKRYHTVLIKNMMQDFAKKNLNLYDQIYHTSKQSTKQKILAYLSDEAIRHQSTEFDIPYDRRELAEYLSVERSAMSTCINQLARDGYYEVEKNHFILKKIQIS